MPSSLTPPKGASVQSPAQTTPEESNAPADRLKARARPAEQEELGNAQLSAGARALDRLVGKGGGSRRQQIKETAEQEIMKSEAEKTEAQSEQESAKQKALEQEVEASRPKNRFA